MNQFEQDVITRYQEKLASMEKDAISWGRIIDAVKSRNQVMDPLEGAIEKSPANSMSASVKRHIGDTVGEAFGGGVPDFMVGDASPGDYKFNHRLHWLNDENDLLNHMHGSKVPEKDFNRILMSDMGLNNLEQIHAEKHPDEFWLSGADRETPVSPSARKKLLNLFGKTRKNSPYSSLLGRLKLKLRGLI